MKFFILLALFLISFNIIVARRDNKKKEDKKHKHKTPEKEKAHKGYYFLEREVKEKKDKKGEWKVKQTHRENCSIQTDRKSGIKDRGKRERQWHRSGVPAHFSGAHKSIEK